MHANVKRAVILLLGLSLFLGNATAMLENTNCMSLPDSVGLVASLSNHSENDAFKQRINLAPFNRLKITVTDVPSDIWFIILQIHTFQYNATLSYDKELHGKVSNGSLFGSNIGLYLNTHNATAPIEVFLKHDNVNDLDALLVIVTYGQNAPIPGGCNMEFDIEVSPYRKLHTENEIVTVDTEPASVLVSDGSPISCEKIRCEVQYKLYRLYLLGQNFTPDAYFDAIASMLTTQDIAQNGDEIGASTSCCVAERSDGIGTGIGSIYALVAIYENYSSAYVPIFTYACNPQLWRESYQVLGMRVDDTATKFLALLLILKCLSIIIDRKYGRISRTLNYWVLYGICGYALARIIDFSHGISILIGLICTIINMIATPCCVSSLKDLLRCSRCTMKLLRNMTFMLISAGITYHFIPSAYYYMIVYLDNGSFSGSFWLMVMIIILLIIIILMTLTYMELKFSHAINVFIYNNLTWLIWVFSIGTYLVLGGYNYYIESSNSTIIMRRVTIPGYHLACIYPLPVSHVTLILFCFSPTILLLTYQCALLLPTNHKKNKTNKSKPKKVQLKCQVHIVKIT
ncbi:transmembrane 7 superfamily member 3-like [Temnothorax curvispinosus]|uniref:Transmembrane 7 superfamily member 3-like n=1 Tax=Temnothorax curvispinosus TaxID=300111 RepID=A0A6J1RMN6_9HYME|nr:transmembrane 7 superfamily member 3-like [Temnothorax curvispinosus]